MLSVVPCVVVKERYHTLINIKRQGLLKQYAMAVMERDGLRSMTKNEINELDQAIEEETRLTREFYNRIQNGSRKRVYR